MCGRFALIGDPFELGFKDNFNIAPSTDIPVKTLDCDGQFMKWSFSPSWKNDMNLINCRSETLFDKPSFKRAKRCIIPFSGWYEWKRFNEKKVPYFHYSSAPYFAGIYNERGCCILTRESSDKIKFIHHRQPVLLGKYDIGDYFMGKNIFDSEVNSNVKFHEVSVLVNNPKNNNADLTSRVN
ncbi:MAG: SOS response-associated peptidase [SAR86 cluster bacterium]|nr:MAG: SOS response-associated peptidase [SAR86 cluster bacterium]